MQTNFSNYDAVELLQTVETDLGININTSCQRSVIPIPSKTGQGKITTYLFRDGFSFFLFDGQLKMDWEWEFQCEEDSPFFMFFLLNGKVMDKRIDKEKQFTLSPMQTFMTFQPGGSRRSIVFKSGEHITLAVLRIDWKRYFSKKGCCLDDMPSKLRTMYTSADREHSCLYPPNRFSIKAEEIVKEITACTFQGMMKTCFVEGKARELLSLKMQLFEEDFFDPSESIKLKENDFQKIMLARDILISDLQDPPTIKELSKKAGLNRQKLKSHFKMVFGQTIYQYLTRERMLAAKEMMLEKCCSVKEIAFSVGFENAGHFSRNFQKEVGMLPSKFLARAWRRGQEN